MTRLARLRFGSLSSLALLVLAGTGCERSHNFADPSDAGVGGGSSSSGTGASTCEPGSILSCYTGAPVTEGIGVCKAGTKECSAEGTDDGSCAGEVTPAADDDCATPEDDDCSGFACGQTMWSKSFSGSFNLQYDKIFSTLDPFGNTFFYASLAVTIDFGGGPLVPSGTNLFLAKFDPTGKHVWSKRFGDALGQEAGGVATDSAGNVVITGKFGGELDLGGATLKNEAQSADIFVAKLDPNGNHIVSRSFGNPQYVHVRDIAIDGAGRIVITGLYVGGISFGGGVSVNSSGGGDVYVWDTFVAKLRADDPFGLWAITYGDPNTEAAGTFIAIDSSDSILLGGDYRGSLSLGGATIYSASGSTDPFAAKLDANGNRVWMQSFGDESSAQSVLDVAVDLSGNVLLTGYTQGSLYFSGEPQHKLTGPGGYFVKLDAGGNYVVGKSLLPAYSASIAVGPTGDIIVGGTTSEPVDFGGGLLASTGGSDVFAATFDSKGTHKWSKLFGNGEYHNVVASAVASGPGSLLVAGRIGPGTLDFGTGALDQGLFAAVFAPR